VSLPRFRELRCGRPGNAQEFSGPPFVRVFSDPL
jgi:hypothetical protein